MPENSGVFTRTACGDGGGTLVSGVTGIPLFYDWVPYDNIFFNILMVGF